MKKTTKITIITAIASIITGSYLSLQSLTSMKEESLLLQNIEAIAAGEETDHIYYCYGEGEVVCPSSGQKMKGYYMNLSLDDFE